LNQYRQNRVNIDQELADAMSEFSDHLFGLELIRYSLDEIRVGASELYSNDQLAAHCRAHELINDVVDFLVHEASHWGVSEEMLQLCVHRRWKEYADEIGAAGSSELESHKRFLEHRSPKSIGYFPESEVLH